MYIVKGIKAGHSATICFNHDLFRTASEWQTGRVENADELPF
jgi:hypothetical protein